MEGQLCFFSKGGCCSIERLSRIEPYHLERDRKHHLLGLHSSRCGFNLEEEVLIVRLVALAVIYFEGVSH